MSRLLRCLFWKSASWRPAISAGSPGRSILMTSAPQSASCRTQTGPARAWVKSRTTRSCKAREAGLYGMATISPATLALLLGNDRLGALGEILGGGKDFRHRGLEHQAGDRIDLDPRGGGCLDEGRVLDGGIERRAQGLHPLDRDIGRGRQRLAQRIAGIDQRHDLAVALVAGQLLHRGDVRELFRFRLGLDQDPDLLVLYPGRVE